MSIKLRNVSPGLKNGAMGRMIKPYATVYPFFSYKLGLHGSDLLTFAVVFSFWKKRGDSVRVSYRMVRTITGLSRSSVGKSIRSLSERGLIAKEKTSRGYASRLSVVLPGNVDPEEWNAPPVQNRDGNPSRIDPTPRPKSGPHNKTVREINNRDNIDEKRSFGPIDIPDPAEFDGGDSW